MRTGRRLLLAAVTVLLAAAPAAGGSRFSLELDEIFRPETQAEVTIRRALWQAPTARMDMNNEHRQRALGRSGLIKGFSRYPLSIRLKVQKGYRTAIVAGEGHFGSWYVNPSLADLLPLRPASADPMAASGLIGR